MRKGIRRKTLPNLLCGYIRCVDSCCNNRKKKKTNVLSMLFSSFGCSHSGVTTADVFKHPHRRFGSVLRRMPFFTQPTDGRELSQLLNVLGCTLEGNQLRHCAAKPIVQLTIIANTSGFLHQAYFNPGTNRV